MVGAVVVDVALVVVESGKVSGKIIQVSTADPSTSAKSRRDTEEEGGAGGTCHRLILCVRGTAGQQQSDMNNKVRPVI